MSLRDQKPAFLRICFAAATLAAIILGLPSASAYFNVFGGPTYTSGVGGFKDGFTTGVNDAGIAIGIAYKFDSSGTILGARPFCWDASGAPATELGNLGTDPSGVTNSYAYAINNAGTVVGSAENYAGAGEYPASLPVRWNAAGTVAVELANFGTDTSNSTSNSAEAINDAGIAVGSTYKYNSSGGGLGGRAVRWDASGTVATELGNLGTEPSGHTNTWASDINNAGTIVGDAWKFDSSGVPLGTRAVRWDATGTVATEFGHLGTGIDGFTYNGAYAINDAGTAIGWAAKFDGAGGNVGHRAVRWDAAVTIATELENLGTDIDGVANIFPTAINNAGTIVGYAEKYDGSGEFLGFRAVRWGSSGTVVTELGHLGTDVDGVAISGAGAINDAGIAVGVAEDYDASGTLLGNRAVYWSPDGVAVDLNTLIDPASGWTLEIASAISDTGWIAGDASFDPDGPGAEEAYVRLFLMQVPELSVLPGDFNHDGAVNAADYVAWRKSPSTFGGNPGGYNTWRTHFGKTLSSNAALADNAVPEPAHSAVIVFAVLTLVCQRRHGI